MKQPELGQKIQDLRKQKGLTQEELVEKCNINVRTIQRIEAGEVTPRSYTIKTILGALGYDLETINHSSSDREHQLIEPEKIHYTIKTLTLACVFGGIYFLLGFPEFYADWSRLTENEIPYPTTVYIVLKVFTLISLVFFIKGFWVLGTELHNTILKFSSLVLILLSTLIYIYDITSLFVEIIPMEYFISAMSISLGAIGVLFGIGILKLKSQLGNTALATGVFEIVVSVFFFTVILAWLGYILMIPLILLEIILLYKAIDLIKKQRNF
ncbi:MAG: helix-turn-helix domain-containing protein [Flavobacteriaceae bacterium]|nr:helix-turn-helix domain-containing protein [Flavobacteriaceae bacterium]